MLTLNDGRAELWQWDTGRTLAVDADCSQVHFSNKVFGRSIDVDVVAGAADIPDILLQTDKDLNVWAFVGTAENGYTKISKTFKVNRRNKPADYVFTPTDQMTLQTIQRQIGNLSDLTTEAKDTLVAAINEAARSGGGGSTVELDTTLTQSGKAADAKAVGDAIRSLSEEIANKAANVYIGPVQPTDGTLYWLDTSESGSSGGETVTYSITAALTNVTIDNTAESANEGESFAAAITVSDGYELSSVSITMGGADITNTAYASGNIYISAVTGDVVITAVAVEVSGEVTTYTITNNLFNVTSDNSAVSAEENSAYTATLTAADGYTLDAVTVTMGGVNVTDSVYANGVITIPAVTGNVVITATSIEGVWKAVEVTNMPSSSLNLYSDDGTTLIATTARAHSHTAVFDTETEVKIALVLNSIQYGTLYVGMNTADDNRNGYYAENFGISGYPQAGTTYERTFTVKAGYALMVGGWNDPSAIESLTVLKKG